jgi:hypothetical protein
LCQHFHQSIVCGWIHSRVAEYCQSFAQIANQDLGITRQRVFLLHTHYQWVACDLLDYSVPAVNRHWKQRTIECSFFKPVLTIIVGAICSGVVSWRNRLCCSHVREALKSGRDLDDKVLRLAVRDPRAGGIAGKQVRRLHPVTEQDNVQGTVILSGRPEKAL